MNIHPFPADDWTDIRRLASEAAPWAADMNDAWLTARQAFDAISRVRRHYLATDETGMAIGYAAVEQDPEPTSYRLFVVAAHPQLDDGTADALLRQLLSDLRLLRARRAWMREEARDPLLAFASSHGFSARRQYTYDGVDIVELEMMLGLP